MCRTGDDLTPRAGELLAEILRQCAKQLATEAGCDPRDVRIGPVDIGPDHDDLVDEQACRVCGCTNEDCTECVDILGEPCDWADVDLCTRCADDDCGDVTCSCHDDEPPARPVVTLAVLGGLL